MGRHLISFNEKDERSALCDESLNSIGNMKGKLVMTLLMFCLETYGPLSKENIREIIFCIENRIGIGFAQPQQPQAPVVEKRKGAASKQSRAKPVKRNDPTNDKNAVTGAKRQATEQKGDTLKPEPKKTLARGFDSEKLTAYKEIFRSMDEGWN